MNGPQSSDRVRQVLALLAEHLERYLEGDALALESLSAVLQDPAYTADDLLAVVWVLRSLGEVPWSDVPFAAETGEEADADPDRPAAGARGPEPQAQRVLSAEERDSLGPEAWGYLLDLRRRGALDAGQFERVLDLLSGSGIRPVSLALAREVAANVVLQLDPEAPGEIPHGDFEVAH